MHVLFRDGFADRGYLAKYTDCPAELEAHLQTRTPEWASAICGVPVAEIEAFARAVGETRRSFFRLGYGFTRSRNGAAQMHAALCIPAVTGAWQYEGGGAFFNNGSIWKFDKTLIEGLDAIDPSTRRLDQSKVGRILTGDSEALKGRGPVKAMLIQNTNPVTVAPEQALVREGFAREDLFVAVHDVADRHRGPQEFGLLMCEGFDRRVAGDVDGMQFGKRDDTGIAAFRIAQHDLLETAGLE